MKGSCLHCKKSNIFKTLKDTHNYQIISCDLCGTKHILSKSIYLDIPLTLLKDSTENFEDDDVDFEEKKSNVWMIVKIAFYILLTLLFASSIVSVCTNLIIHQLFK